MTAVSLEIEEDQARDLYRFLHRSEGQVRFPDVYLQLQKYFFQKMTIVEIQRLLEAPE